MIGSGGFDTKQVSVATAATLIVAARPGRQAITIIQPPGAANPVYLGHDASVLTTTGAPLIATAGASVTIPTQGAVYGIASGGAQTVGYIESY